MLYRAAKRHIHTLTHTYTHSHTLSHTHTHTQKEVRKKATTMGSIGSNEAPGMMRQLLHLPLHSLPLVNGLQKYSLLRPPKCGAE